MTNQAYEVTDLTDEVLLDLAEHGTCRLQADDGAFHLWRIAKCDHGYDVLESISERSQERGLDWAYVAHVSGAFGRRVAIDVRLEDKYAACRNLRYDARIARGDFRDGQRLASTPSEMRMAMDRVLAAMNARNGQ